MLRQHMDPEQALRAFEDLGGRTFVAMHWGTFHARGAPRRGQRRRRGAGRRFSGIAGGNSRRAGCRGILGDGTLPLLGSRRGASIVNAGAHLLDPRGPPAFP